MPQLIGKFVWFECATPDPDKAKGFYGELFGWKIQSFDMGEMKYDMIAVGEAALGGYKKDTKAHWESYVSVADVDATAKKIKAAGGKVLAEPFDAPKVGRMAQVADPEGAVFWIIAGDGDPADAPPAQGRFFWNELWAKDGKAAASFYAKVFDYEHKEMPMPNGAYHVLEKDGVPRAGVMTSPDKKVPPMWLPYVSVDDCDATVTRAKKLGFEVHAPAADIPEVGRYAVLGDPQGAAIAVIKPAAK